MFTIVFTLYKGSFKHIHFQATWDVSHNSTSFMQIPESIIVSKPMGISPQNKVTLPSKQPKWENETVPLDRFN